MTKIDHQSKMRIARAVQAFERMPVTPSNIGTASRGGRHSIAWWGITKEVIDNKDSGEVYMQQGAGDNPTTTGLSTAYTVANPWMGKLIIGMPVLVTPAAIKSVTGGFVWYVMPFELVYEGKVTSSLTAGGSGLVDLWEADVAVSGAVQVTAYHRWVANIDLSAGTKVRVKWDIKLRRFYVDAWLCP